jgi:hypothetical protein
MPYTRSFSEWLYIQTIFFGSTVATAQFQFYWHGQQVTPMLRIYFVKEAALWNQSVRNLFVADSSARCCNNTCLLLMGTH